MNPEKARSCKYDEAYELRPAQIEALSALENAHETGVERGYINMATGLGKTDVAAHDVERFRMENPNARILYLCHNTDILNQARDTFTEVTGMKSHGNVFGGTFEDQESIVYATFQTMGQKLGGGKIYEAFDENEFDYIIVDESHHGPAETYREVIEYFKPQFLLGLTATPERRDQQDIKEIFGEELYTVLLEEAIAKNYLAKPDYRVLTDHVQKLELIETDLGTISLKQLNKEVFVRRRDGEIADMIAEHLYDREDSRTIVFCESIDHAEHMAEQLPGNVATYHSKLSKEVQISRLKAFKAGDIDMLVSIDKLNEGVDVPEANVVVFLRSTESRTVFLQQLGRGLRKITGKEEVLILDFVASWERIRDIKKLEEDVHTAYMPHGARHKPLQARSPFKFDFSEEALHAVEVIEFARNKLAKKPEAVTVDRRTQFDLKTEKLLGTKLPQNRTLSKAREQSLLLLIERGDDKAKREYLSARARTIYNIISKIPEMSGLTREDYFQIGCETVLTDAANGEIRKDTQATTTRLTRTITGTIAATIRAQRLAHPKKLSQRGLPILAAWAEQEAVAPLDEAADLGTDPDDLFEGAVKKIDKKALYNAMENLSHRERKVLEMRYGLIDGTNYNLDEVGRVYNVSRGRIHQIESVALKKLQSEKNAQHLGELATEPNLGYWFKSGRRPEYIKTLGADEVQAQRDKREFEALLSSKYPGDAGTIPKKEVLRAGLSEIIIETLNKLETERPRESYGLVYIHRNLDLPPWMHRLVYLNDVLKSVNLLRDEGRIIYSESPDEGESYYGIKLKR